MAAMTFLRPVVVASAVLLALAASGNIYRRVGAQCWQKVVASCIYTIKYCVVHIIVVYAYNDLLYTYQSRTTAEL